MIRRSVLSHLGVRLEQCATVRRGRTRYGRKRQISTPLVLGLLSLEEFAARCSNVRNAASKLRSCGFTTSIIRGSRAL